jgi:hypothetical protein
VSCLLCRRHAHALAALSGWTTASRAWWFDRISADLARIVRAGATVPPKKSIARREAFSGGEHPHEF